MTLVLRLGQAHKKAYQAQKVCDVHRQVDCRHTGRRNSAGYTCDYVHHEEVSVNGLC